MENKGNDILIEPEYVIRQYDGEFYVHFDGWEVQEPLSKEQIMDRLEKWFEEHT